MKRQGILLCSLAMLVCKASASLLGSAENFAVLGGTTVTNTGPSVITGGLGVSPGSAITGFPPGVVNGTIHSADGVAAQAEVDLTTAYNYLAGLPFDTSLSTDLGGLTLTAGVYNFNTSASLTGTLTFSGAGDFIVQVASSFNAASGSAILTTGGADASHIYFQVGSSATAGTGAALQGNIVSLASISLSTGASLDGRALARNGAVTLDTNIVTMPAIVSGTPEPATFALFSLTMAGALAWVSLKRRNDRVQAPVKAESGK